MRFSPYSRPQAASRSAADFLYELTEDGLLIIIDQDRGNKSVTNDMANVLADIARSERRGALLGRRVAYRDSQGEWARVLLDAEGRFDQFRGFGRRVTDEAEARRLLREVAA